MKSPGCATPTRSCSRAEPRLRGQDDLAERSAIEVIQRLRQLIETVDPVDHRLQVDGVHGAHQIFQRAAVADADAPISADFSSSRPAGRKSRRPPARRSPRWPPTATARTELPRFGPPTVSIMVDAAILRQRINCFHPIAFQPVDAVTGAQRSARASFHRCRRSHTPRRRALWRSAARTAPPAGACTSTVSPACSLPCSTSANRAVSRRTAGCWPARRPATPAPPPASPHAKSHIPPARPDRNRRGCGKALARIAVRFLPAVEPTGAER